MCTRPRTIRDTGPKNGEGEQVTRSSCKRRKNKNSYGVEKREVRKRETDLVRKESKNVPTEEQQQIYNKSHGRRVYNRSTET